MALILFGIPAAIIAGLKGFKWGRWLIALGIIGFIWVICLKSAKADEISPEEADRRAEKANGVGAWLAGINIGLTVIFIFIAVVMNA